MARKIPKLTNRCYTDGCERRTKPGRLYCHPCSKARYHFEMPRI